MARWDKHYGRNIIGQEQMINWLLTKLRNCAEGWISIQTMKICSVYSRFFIYLSLAIGSCFLPIVYSKPTSRSVVFLISMISVTLSSCWKHVLKSIDFTTSSRQQMEACLILEYLKLSCVKSSRCDESLSLFLFYYAWPSALCKSSLGSNDLLVLFTKYSTNVNDASFMTVESFNAFLLSPDNCAFSDQHSTTWHDMTRPLSEYYISSSHNTYLVGHQLVGVSTIEGYIRALLHSCRSVEGKKNPFLSGFTTYSVFFI